MARQTRPSLDDWRVQRLMDWLCTLPAERVPFTLVDLANELDVNRMTLNAWKNDPDFLAAWENRYRKTIGSVERQQEIMQRLFETATDRTDPRQVVAAKAYFEALGIAKPQKPTAVPKDAKKLKDEDLFAILAERAAAQATDG